MSDKLSIIAASGLIPDLANIVSGYANYDVKRNELNKLFSGVVKKEKNKRIPHSVGSFVEYFDEWDCEESDEKPEREYREPKYRSRNSGKRFQSF